MLVFTSMRQKLLSMTLIVPVTFTSSELASDLTQLKRISGEDNFLKRIANNRYTKSLINLSLIKFLPFWYKPLGCTELHVHKRWMKLLISELLSFAAAGWRTVLRDLRHSTSNYERALTGLQEGPFNLLIWEKHVKLPVDLGLYLQHWYQRDNWCFQRPVAWSTGWGSIYPSCLLISQSERMQHRCRMLPHRLNFWFAMQKTYINYAHLLSSMYFASPHNLKYIPRLWYPQHQGSRCRKVVPLSWLLINARTNECLWSETPP